MGKATKTRMRIAMNAARMSRGTFLGSGPQRWKWKKLWPFCWWVPEPTAVLLENTASIDIAGPT